MNLQEVFSVWRALNESKSWCEPTWAQQYEKRPSCVSIGSDVSGEVFAVIDVTERRVLTEEQFPNELLFDDRGWRDMAA